MFTFLNTVSSLSNKELLDYSFKVARHEDEVGLQIIACLREAERRQLFLELKLGSLWEFATQYLKLSKGNAQNKIDAMRLCRDNPLAKEKIKSGELTILNAAKVNSFLRQEQKAGKTYTPEQKAEVIESVVDLTQSQCERALLARSPEMIPSEKVRPLTETQTELKIVVDAKTMTTLNRLKELLSHKMPGASYGQLLEFLAREKVEALEKKLMGGSFEEMTRKELESVSTSAVKEAPGLNSDPPPAPTIGVTAEGRPVEAVGKLLGRLSSAYRKYISVKDRRWVMNRAKGQYEHLNTDGTRCSSRWQLELDHIVPLAINGKNDRTNYRVLCKIHNLHHAKVNLGDWVSQYVSSFR